MASTLTCSTTTGWAGRWTPWPARSNRSSGRSARKRSTCSVSTSPAISISPYGAYPNTDDDSPAPAFGHPKDRRTDLKQIQAGLAVSADGGVPVFARADDGNAAEIAQVTDTMRALQKLAGPRDFRLAATPNSGHPGLLPSLRRHHGQQPSQTTIITPRT